MPIYEYECQACKAHVELLQKISDEPAKECPHCHKKKLKKLVSAAGFRLKGGGWYETDFKSGNKKNLAAGGEASKGSDSSSDSGKNSSAAVTSSSSGESSAS